MCANQVKVFNPANNKSYSLYYFNDDFAQLQHNTALYK